MSGDASRQQDLTAKWVPQMVRVGYKSAPVFSHCEKGRLTFMRISKISSSSSQATFKRIAVEWGVSGTLFVSFADLAKAWHYRSAKTV